MEAISPMSVDWGVASLPLNGQSESGDRHVVHFFPGGVLLAVIDGLGHGDEAAAAANAAEFILQAQPQAPVISLVQHCHESLRSTRGVVMSVASFDISRGLMTWLGVGNVRGVLRRSPSSSNLPLQVSVVPVAYGDTLFLATDGIRGEFAQDRMLSELSQRTAEVILSRYAKGNDDALVLVARVVGNRE
jgi:serine/threonine protein phosphatase PrpC